MKTRQLAMWAGVGVASAAALAALVWLDRPDAAPRGAAAPAAPPASGAQAEAGVANSSAQDVAGSDQNADEEPMASVPPDPGLDVAALAATVLDGNAELHQRQAAVSALAGAGGVGAVDALLAVASSVLASDQTSPLSHALAQEIAGLSTPEAVERMGLIFTDGRPGYPEFASLPVSLQDAIQSSLRKNPDDELVAKFLIEQHSSAVSELAKSRIQMLEHPETTARLAQAAFQQGNTPLWQERMAMLETTRDPRVYDAVVRLARASMISNSDVQSLVYNWASNDPQLMDAGRGLSDLRSASLSAAERSAAAFALAGLASSSASGRDEVLAAYDALLAQPALDGRLRESVLRAQKMLMAP